MRRISNEKGSADTRASRTPARRRCLLGLAAPPPAASAPIRPPGPRPPARLRRRSRPGARTAARGAQALRVPPAAHGGVRPCRVPRGPCPTSARNRSCGCGTGPVHVPDLRRRARPPLHAGHPAHPAPARRPRDVLRLRRDGRREQGPAARDGRRRTSDRQSHLDPPAAYEDEPGAMREEIERTCEVIEDAASPPPGSAPPTAPGTATPSRSAPTSAWSRSPGPSTPWTGPSRAPRRSSGASRAGAAPGRRGPLARRGRRPLAERRGPAHAIYPQLIDSGYRLTVPSRHSPETRPGPPGVGRPPPVLVVSAHPPGGRRPRRSRRIRTAWSIRRHR